MPDLGARVRASHQAVEARGTRLLLALPNLLAARRAGMVQVELRMPPPRSLVSAQRAQFRLTGAGLDAARQQVLARQHIQADRTLDRLSAAPLRGAIRESRARLDGLAARLSSVSHNAVLARGYAMVYQGTEPVTQAGAISPGAALRLRFMDGDVAVTAAGTAAAGQGLLPI